MKIWGRQLLLGLACSVCALPALAVGEPPPLRVIAARETPFFYVENGAMKGIEYEILSYFAKSTGRRLEVQWAEKFSDLLDTLGKGGCDIASGSITVTPQRRERFGFSSAYLTIRVVLVEPKAQTTERLDQLRGATLAAIRGSTYETLLARAPDVDFIYGARADELLGMVASGKARATAVDSLIALVAIQKYPQLKLSLPLSGPESYGFAVAKGSPLEGELSAAIERLRGSKKYFEILQRHLGSDAAQLVGAAN